MNLAMDALEEHMTKVPFCKLNSKQFSSIQILKTMGPTIKNYVWNENLK